MKRSSVYSTSLIGTQTQAPGWVKPEQSSVPLSGFLNDLPSRVDTAYGTSVSGTEGKLLFNKADKRLYVYEGQGWHMVSGETASNQGGFSSLFLIGVHTSSEPVILTQGGSVVPSSDNTFRILTSESAILEGTISIQPFGGPTQDSGTQSCKFHALISRDSSGIIVNSFQPVMFWFSSPKPTFEIEVTPDGLVLLKVTVSTASSGQGFASVAYCSIVKVG